MQQRQYEDSEIGLYYNRFRYYDAESGVYISQDPIGLSGGMPNMYSYVWDSNVMNDLLGLAGFVTAVLNVDGVENVAKSKKTTLSDGAFKDIVESVKTDLAKKGKLELFHGNCAEIRAINKALEDGVKLEQLKGAKMKATITKTGEIKKACDCCKGVMDNLGIKEVCH